MKSLKSNSDIKNVREMVIYFCDKSGVKYDNHSFVIAISQVKSLVKKGYSFEDIKETIDYAVKNSPPKGIYSFGYITTVIDDIQNKLKDLENQPTLEKISIKDIKTTGNKNKMRKNKLNYDESLFK